GWGQLVHAASGVSRARTRSAHWVVPARRALWVPPGRRPEIQCVTGLSFCTLYFAPNALPALPDRCTVLVLGPLLRELIVEVAARAPIGEATEGPHSRLVAVLRDELSRARREPTLLPMPTDPAARHLAERVLADVAAQQSIDELCVGCGASKRTLERRFSSETGTSLGSWRRQARLQHAMVGLGQGRPVAVVAEEVGYRSPSAFVHAFRQSFGCTPARWLGTVADTNDAPVPAGTGVSASGWRSIGGPSPMRPNRRVPDGSEGVV
ncbi:MAG: helix-turn-helix transcriptional regulator, partial [Myxococcota bacterium]